jgi:Fur family peroxide stress response transcriptional regulator
MSPLSNPECASVRELFMSHGLRCTRQRLALYEALRQSGDHPTAEELYRTVHAKSSRMSRATVYNTLLTLCRAGLARQMPTANGTCRYDADTAGHVHIQMIDTATVMDVPIELGERLVAGLPHAVIEEIERRSGVRIDGACIQLIAHGKPSPPVTALSGKATRRPRGRPDASRQATAG